MDGCLALGVDTAPLLERWLASSSPRAGHLLAREVVDLAWWTNNSHSGGRSPDLDAMLVRDPRVRVAVARSRVIEETTAEHAMLLLDFPPFAYRT